MPDLVNIGPAAVDVYAPSGHPDSLHVEPGQTITVPGELAEQQPVDAIVIGSGDDARAWPRSQWDMKPAEPPKTPAKPAAKTPASEGTN